MNVCRGTTADDSPPPLGVLEGALRSGVSREPVRKRIGGRESSADASVLAPIVRPTNHLGVGLDFAGHAVAGGDDISGTRVGVDVEGVPTSSNRVDAP